MSFADQVQRTSTLLALTPGWQRVQALRPDCDDTTVATMLDAAAGFAETTLAPLNPVGDRVGAQVVDGKVKLPPGFVDGFRQYAEAGSASMRPLHSAASIFRSPCRPPAVRSSIAAAWR